MPLDVRKAHPSDEAAILALVRTAFGEAEGGEIADLVVDLCRDPTAQPSLSLVAVSDKQIVGHILFTKVRLEGPRPDTPSSILCPLAVHPAKQNQGIGRRLIEEGLSHLRADGTALVFVLGHPGYYPRFGFTPAGARGFEAPYPVLPTNAEAWMVLALEPTTLAEASGRVVCADALDDPRHWVE
jgi:predicted N-acetyltransferase YhbS